MNTKFLVSYDDIGDVLYVVAQRADKMKNREDEAGLVLGYDLSTNKPVAATIVDYKTYWSDQRQHLVDRLSDFFHVTKDDARKALRAAH